jgi:hypothetical protein
LIGESQKGHVYYRCHTKECPTKAIREEAVEDAISHILEPLYFEADERPILLRTLAEVKEDLLAQWEAETNSTRVQLGHLRERIDRLTDAYIDRMIEKDTFESRKATLLMEQKTLEEKIGQPKSAVLDRLTKFLELAGDAHLLYQTALPEERRELLKVVTSNRAVSGKNIAITLRVPFREVADRYISSNGRPYRGRHRTLETLLHKLITWFAANPTESSEVPCMLPDHHTEDRENLKARDSAR